MYDVIHFSVFDRYIEQDLKFESFGNLGLNYSLVKSPLVCLINKEGSLFISIEFLRQSVYLGKTSNYLYG